MFVMLGRPLRFLTGRKKTVFLLLIHCKEMFLSYFLSNLKTNKIQWKCEKVVWCVVNSSEHTMGRVTARLVLYVNCQQKRGKKHSLVCLF